MATPLSANRGGQREGLGIRTTLGDSEAASRSCRLAANERGEHVMVGQDARREVRDERRIDARTTGNSSVSIMSASFASGYAPSRPAQRWLRARAAGLKVEHLTPDRSRQPGARISWSGGRDFSCRSEDACSAGPALR